MKAVLCKAWGPPDSLVVEDLPPPVAEPGKVVVTVKAAGVNFPDTLIIQNRYQHKPPLPFSPGAEVAGVIESIGEGVAGWTVGERVIAQTTYGGFAEQLVAAPDQLIRMPQGMDFPVAASLGLAYGTSYYGLIERGCPHRGGDSRGGRAARLRRADRMPGRRQHRGLVGVQRGSRRARDSGVQRAGRIGHRARDRLHHL